MSNSTGNDKIVDMKDKLKTYYNWKSKNIYRYEINLHTTNDEDVIEKLEEQENKRQYLINLIRKDIESGKKV